MHFFGGYIPFDRCSAHQSWQNQIETSKLAKFFPKQSKNGKNLPKWQEIRVHHTVLVISMILDSPCLEDFKNTKIVNGVSFFYLNQIWATVPGGDPKVIFFITKAYATTSILLTFIDWMKLIFSLWLKSDLNKKWDSIYNFGIFEIL